MWSTSPFLVLFVGLHLASICSAITHLRRGPQAGSTDPVILRGSVVVENPSSDENAPTLKRVPWSAKLMKDIVTWYDLTADQIKFSTCSSSVIVMEGDKLDKQDYAIGTIFVVDVAPWERNCGTPGIVPDVDQNDDVLFYEVVSRPKARKVPKIVNVTLPNGKVQQRKKPIETISFKIARVSGRDVIPEVDLSLTTGPGEPAPGAKAGDIVFFDNTPAGLAARQATLAHTTAHQSLLLPVSQRFLNLDRRFDLGEGVFVDARIAVNARIRNLTVIRAESLEYSYNQFLQADMNNTFLIPGNAPGPGTQASIQEEIPRFGFKDIRIPFIGRTSVIGYARVSTEFSVSASLPFNATSFIKGEFRTDVIAKFPNDFSTTVRDIQFASTEDPDLSFTGPDVVRGFMLMRPAVGLRIEIGRRASEANTGVGLGKLITSKVIIPPPFQPPEDELIKVGFCDVMSFKPRFLECCCL